MPKVIALALALSPVCFATEPTMDSDQSVTAPVVARPKTVPTVNGPVALPPGTCRVCDRSVDGAAVHCVTSRVCPTKQAAPPK